MKIEPKNRNASTSAVADRRGGIIYTPLFGSSPHLANETKGGLSTAPRSAVRSGSMVSREIGGRL